jgi:hypothetical protein
MIKTSKTSSNSSTKVTFQSRFSYLLDLLKMRINTRGDFDNSKCEGLISEYQRIANKYKFNLSDAQILEIGIGQRPYLGITFVGLGYDYRGIDLDSPVFPPSSKVFLKILRTNGFLRFLKTFIRYFVFDRDEYKILLDRLGLDFLHFKNRMFFFQGDAAEIDLHHLLKTPQRQFEPSSISIRPLVVVSESVFEHIPTPSLVQILSNLFNFSVSTGRPLLILTRPTIFTGITGSHLTEWFVHRVYDDVKTKLSQPWEHLRGQRYTADTYLNKLSRAEYRLLFQEAGFEITCETELMPGLGRTFLQQPDIRKDLEHWSDDELLSNDVMFELVPLNGMLTHLQ